MPVVNPILNPALQITTRLVTIVDLSGIYVKAVLWGRHVEEFSVPEGTVVVFRRVKVDGDGAGGYLKSLSH